MKINGWGRFPSFDNTKTYFPHSRSGLKDIIRGDSSYTARGLGRSYGDSANGAYIIQSNCIDHFISFDEVHGIFSCESGVSIREVLDFIVPRGWFIPVTPGTAYVTIGGAIASDVHGKNHHVCGTFSDYVISLELMLGDGDVVRISAYEMPELFQATCGGMGLTGMILSATFRLLPIASSQINQITHKASCLQEVCALFEVNKASTYSVAWIDCLAKKGSLGRSILMLGEHADVGNLELAEQKSIGVPFDMPGGLLNPYFMKMFNAWYFHKVSAKTKKNQLPLEAYFYPLDKIAHWNRLYGKNGFIQYQFVIPKAVGADGLQKILEKIAASDKGSFLAVLKLFGPQNTNYLSFPIEGYTLALDFRLTSDIPNFVETLNHMVLEMGGRIYLTKDALMSEDMFKRSYPAWEVFESVRAKYGAIGKFSSQQSRRLGLA